MLKLTLLVLGLIFSASIRAQDDTILVITYEPIPQGPLVGFSNIGNTFVPGLESVPVEIEKESLEDAVRKVKSSICLAVGDASVKVYFTFDAGMRAFGLGTSAGAGIEVTFDCKTS